MYTIAVIIGSLRKASINKALAGAVAIEGKDLFTFNVVAIDDIPLFNEDLEQDVPAAVTKLREAVTQADAVLFVTPEYNRSVPGVLKNVVDWASRPSGKSCLKDKPAAIMGTSGSAVGTAVAQSHLRGILSMIGMPFVKQPELYISMKPDLIGADGAFAEASTKKFIRGFLEGMNAWLAKR